MFWPRHEGLSRTQVRIVAQLPRQERRLAALALEHLTADTCPQDGYTVAELATELDENSTELARVLARLEEIHILRKQPGDKGFLLYDDFFRSYQAME